MYSYITKFNINQELLCNKFPRSTVTLLYYPVWLAVHGFKQDRGQNWELNEEKYSRNKPRGQRVIIQVWETGKEYRRETMKKKAKEYWSEKDQRQYSLVWKHQKTKKQSWEKGGTEMNKRKQSKNLNNWKKGQKKENETNKGRKMFLWCPQFCVVDSKSELKTMPGNSAKPAVGLVLYRLVSMCDYQGQSPVSNFMYVLWYPIFVSLAYLSLCHSPSCCSTLRQRQPKAAPSPVYSWLLLALAQLLLFHFQWHVYILPCHFSQDRRGCCYLTHWICHHHRDAQGYGPTLIFFSSGRSADCPLFFPPQLLKSCTPVSLSQATSCRAGRIMLFHPLPSLMLMWYLILLSLGVPVNFYGTQQ